MKIKALIFDYGGTLDTAGCHWGKVLWHAYQRMNVPVSEDAFREAYVYAERYLGSHALIKPADTFHDTLRVKLGLELDFLEQQGGLSETAAQRQQRLADMLQGVYHDVCGVTEHSRDVLSILRRHYNMVIVSNFYGNLRTVLNEFGLLGLVDGVIESAEVGVRKPDERIFELGLKALNRQPDEVLVVGDSIKNDILPAHRLGCHTAWLRGEGWAETPDRCDEADIIVNDLNILAKQYLL